VGHPFVRVNFDTANVHYYNRDVNSVEELKKVMDYVGSVHVKDTTGEYETWNFPALGRGVVDFPEIFRLLGDQGFTGPYTMELEGVKGWTPSEEERLAYVAESAGYLREIGALG